MAGLSLKLKLQKDIELIEVRLVGLSPEIGGERWCPTPSYSFICGAKSHPADEDRKFVEVIEHKSNKRIDQSRCSCGGVAKRDLVGDLASVNMTGATPISHATTGPGSVAKSVEFMAGQFKTNPDGSVDKNHRPFRDTGELNRYMNGENELGKPKTDDSGNPIRRSDGSIVRDGAKLFKYGVNDTPSRSAARSSRPSYPDAWVGENDGAGAGGGAFKQLGNAKTYKSPKRGR